MGEAVIVSARANEEPGPPLTLGGGRSYTSRAEHASRAVEGLAL
jgi:hypothetical protein